MFIKAVFTSVKQFFFLILFSLIACTAIDSYSYSSPQDSDAGWLAYVHDGDLLVKKLPDGLPEKLAAVGDASNPIWSPSGQWIAYRRGQDFRQIWIINRSGGAKELEKNGVDTFRWSPTADTLAYTVDGNVRVVSAPDWNKRDISNRKGASGLAWSPDGQWIAWDAEKHVIEGVKHVSSLWRSHSDGSNRKEIFSDIYESATQEKLIEKYRRAAQLNNKTEMNRIMAEMEAGARVAGWSTDGQYILFWSFMPFSLSAQADGSALHAIPAAGGKPHRLVSSMLNKVEYIQSAPNDNRIAVTAGGDRFTTSEKAIAVIDPTKSTKNDQVLIGKPLATLLPTWSPNGEQIAFVVGRDIAGSSTDTETASEKAAASRHIGIMRSDGSAKQQLTEGSTGYRDERPLWSRDGRFIVFARLDQNKHPSIWMIRSDGSQLIRVVDEMNLTKPIQDIFGYVPWHDYFDYWNRSVIVGNAIPTTIQNTLISDDNRELKGRKFHDNTANASVKKLSNNLNLKPDLQHIIDENYKYGFEVWSNKTGNRLWRLVDINHNLILTEMNEPELPKGYNYNYGLCKMNRKSRPDIIAAVKYGDQEWSKNIKNAWVADPQAKQFIQIDSTNIICINEGWGV